MDLDPSLAFTALLELWPGAPEGTSAELARAMTAANPADRFEFARQWVAQRTAPRYPSLEEAARAYGGAHGISHFRGGWLRADGERTSRWHGWDEYGQHLVSKGIVQPQDARGVRVDREKTAWGVRVRSYRHWRMLATQYVIIHKED